MGMWNYLIVCWGTIQKETNEARHINWDRQNKKEERNKIETRVETSSDIKTIYKNENLKRKT